MKRTLQNIYENMVKEEVEEIQESTKNKNSFSNIDLKDYTEIIYEGKSGHGDMKAVTNLLDSAVKEGIVTAKDTKSGWLVKSTKDPSKQELIHKGERAFHYLRRFLNKLS